MRAQQGEEEEELAEEEDGDEDADFDGEEDDLGEEDVAAELAADDYDPTIVTGGSPWRVRRGVAPKRPPSPSRRATGRRD